MNSLCKTALVTICALTALSAQARPDEVPLLTKSIGSGYVFREYAGSQRCEVFATRVDIHRCAGFVCTTETHPVKHIDQQGLNTILAQAAATTDTELTDLGPAPMDAPLVTEAGSHHGNRNILLRYLNSNGHLVENRTRAAQALRFTLNNLCGSEGWIGF